MKETSIAKNAAIVGFMTFISRVGGLIREVLMAHFFGSGVVKSAFDIAYRIPNLIRRLFGEGALSAALIPIYTETLAKEGKREADKLAAAVSGITVAFLGVVTAIGFLLTFAFAALALDDRWMEIMPLLRIMLPYAPLICLAALIMGVLNSLKSFAMPALAPAFQNLCCIVALILVCPFVPDTGTLRIRIVSWSILVSGVIQVLVQLPVLRRHGVPLSLAIPIPVPGNVRRVFALTAPMALSAGVVQINVCIDSALAMKAGVWGPSVLGYADRIVYLPLAIFGTAFSTVLLPTLSSFATEGDYGSFSHSLERFIRNVIVVMMPSALGMIALAYPIISLIYQTGAFDQRSSARTAVALVAYSVGLVPAGLHKIAVTAFYARKDARTPMVVSTAGVFLNLAMNLFFIWVLQPELKPIGIAIATSISSTIAVAVLLAILSRRDAACGARLFSLASAARTFASALVAALAMGVACKLVSDYARGQFAVHAIPEKLALLATLCVAIPLGAALYFAIMRILCPAAIRELLSDLSKRRKAKA